MLVLSHRGNCAGCPENTIEAFRAAVTLGVDGIETDVRLSADGLPILCHDRVAPDGREVASLTRDELAEVLGHSVATLDEALDFWAKGLWNIEIKTPSAVDAALRVLGDYVTSHQMFITSFWHGIVRDVARDPRFRCGILTASCPATYQALVSLIDNATMVDSIVWDYEVFDSALVRPLAEKGIKNFVYGVKNEREHDRCESLGLDGVITDHPGYLLARREVSDGICQAIRGL